MDKSYSMLQFLIWQLLNPSCFLECDPCCCHGLFSYTFCHNASGKYLFSGAFAYIRDSIVKFRTTLPLEHGSGPYSTKPVLPLIPLDLIYQQKLQRKHLLRKTNLSFWSIFLNLFSALSLMYQFYGVRASSCICVQISIWFQLTYLQWLLYGEP